MNAADEILGPSLAAGRGDNLAIICGPHGVTYADLDCLTNKFGNAVLSLGVHTGEPVLMLMSDTPQLVAAYLGVMRVGGVSVALNTRLAAKDIAYIIADSGARLLLADGEFLSLIGEARLLLSDFPRVVATDGQAESVVDLIADQSEELTSAEMKATDPCLWSYTSGTTGQPKGVVHMHGSIPLGANYVREVLQVKPGMRMFSSSKLFFAYSLGQCLIGGLRIGATLILYKGWPDAAAMTTIIERDQPDVVLSVPAMYRLMLRAGVANNQAFGRVRTYVSAGERLPEQLCRAWMDATHTTLLEAFGTTEVLYLFISTTRDAVRPGSCGRPLPWAEARLISRDGQEITWPNEPGDLWVRIHSLFHHYHNLPEASIDNVRDGWCRTGDIFSIDSEGWWHALGRSDEMLKVSGQWVSPSEVEEIAVTVPGIVEAAAAGVPDEDELVRLVLFAVPAVGESQQELEKRVVDTLRRKLAIYKCPRHVRFVDVIPRTATGKIQRFKLRQMATA